MWCKIKEIDPSYQQFLTPRQIRELDLLQVKKESLQGENKENTNSKKNELIEDCCGDDAVILVIPPYEDSQFESPNHYHNPHKLPSALQPGNDPQSYHWV